MPFYRFRIHGRDPNAPGVHGFYTTRHATAATERLAADKVLAALMAEFTTGVSAVHWSAAPPILTIEDGWRIGLRQLLLAPNRGSTFYDESDVDEPATIVERPE